MGQYTRAPETLPRIDSMLKRVALYIRVSTQDQLLGYGLDIQRTEGIEYIEKRAATGWNLYEIYADEGESGASLTRDAMLRMEQDIKDGKIDIVVVHKFDRVGRTGRAFWRWVWGMQDAGVALVSVTQDIDTTSPTGVMALQQYAMFAEMEWRTIKERTVRGINYKAATGGWPAGAPPFGYMLEGKGKRGSTVIPNPAEVLVLEAAIELIVDKKKSCPQAADALNGLNQRTRSGKPWTADNLRCRLMGSSLDGFVRYRNPDRKGQAKNTLVVDRDGNPLLGPTVDVQLPPIIDPSRIAAVRSRLSARSSTWTSSGHTYILTKRLFGQCGQHFNGRFVSTTKTSSYQCSGVKGKSSCGCSYYPAADMEAAVWNEVMDVVGNKDLLQRLAEDWVSAMPEEIDNYSRRIENYDAQIAEKTRISTETLIQYAIQGVDPAVVAAAQGKLKEEIDSLNELRTEAVDHYESMIAASERKRDVLALADMARDRLENLPPELKADVLDLLDIRIEIVGEALKAREAYPCQVETFFREHQRMVPGELTDKQWDRIAARFPGLTKGHRAESRAVLDAAFHKVREYLRWADIPAEYPTWGKTVYGAMKRWIQDGTLLGILDALGPYSGTALSETPTLPQMVITGVLDPQVSAVVDGTAAPTREHRTVLAPTGTDSNESVRTGAKTFPSFQVWLTTDRHGVEMQAS